MSIEQVIGGISRCTVDANVGSGNTGRNMTIPVLVRLIRTAFRETVGDSLIKSFYLGIGGGIVGGCTGMMNVE